MDVCMEKWGCGEKRKGHFLRNISLEGANYLCSALSIPAISVMIKVLG